MLTSRIKAALRKAKYEILLDVQHLLP